VNPEFTQLIVIVIVLAMVLFNVISIFRNRAADRAAAEAQVLARRNADALERIARALESRGPA
jgi:Zn-dependent protease with chaperone function